MTVNEIIKIANLRADEEYSEEQVQMFIKDTLSGFSLYSGYIFPPIPIGTDHLNYVPTFTQKIKDPDPKDPKYKEKKAQVDFYNQKMSQIDEIICNTVLAVGAAYYIKVNDGSLVELQNEKKEWENAMDNALSRYGNRFDPSFREENLLGSASQSGSVFTRQGYSVPGRNNTPSKSFWNELDRRFKKWPKD